MATPPPVTALARPELATTADLDAMEARLSRSLTDATAPSSTSPAPSEGAAALAAAWTAEAVEEQVALLVEQVKQSERRLQQLVLAVGVSLLLLGALVSVLLLR